MADIDVDYGLTGDGLADDGSVNLTGIPTADELAEFIQSILRTVSFEWSSDWDHWPIDLDPWCPPQDDGVGDATAQTEAGLARKSADSEAATLMTDDGGEAAATMSMQSFAAAIASTTIETRIAGAADDAEEKASGSITGNVNDLELGFDDSTRQTVGLRFTGIDIPKGAIITNAYIQFTADEVNTGAISLLIRGQDSDDAAAFTTVKFNVSSRPTTDASVGWTPADWTIRGEAGAGQRTPDLKAIIQEIIDRDGWQALNDIAFVITGTTGTRTAKSFDGNAAAAPLLHLEYYIPTASAPVAFNSPADTNSAANQIAELAAVGAVVGITASASDPDASDTVSYSIDDARFSIDASTGVITRSGVGVLDFETQTSITLTVTATSSDLSTATQTFTLGILNSQEPVAFNTPADTDTATNQIGQNAAAGTKVGITASAADPDAGSTVSYSLNDTRFSIDAGGIITRSGTGTLNAQSQPTITLTVTATSSDGSTATQDYNVNVTTGIPSPPTSVTLMHTVLTSQWSPASPDPSGITYISHLGTLMISDAEVDEMSIFQGKNLFEMSLNGSLVRSLTTTAYSDEPSGVAYNPTNKHLYFSDDTGTKSIYELDPGSDGLYNTTDDIVTSFRTSNFGSSDPEGIAYDTKRGVLYLADGNARIYTINPGANGRFDGVASSGGDDVVTSFSIGSLSNGDPCVEYDPVHDLLYVVKSRTQVVMMSTTGTQLGTLDISAANARKVAGLALAPSSDDGNQMSLYIVDRGVDNDSNPNENDGKLYEFRLDHWLLA
ncbi:RTX toxin [Ensifer sp. MJa1]|uniref:RTX toxin n=1 Tax=Ensifer sp. MJa1 TaxID=2919888 RepID=UPI00300A3189